MLRAKGFTRLYQDGKTFEFSTPESLLDIDFSRPVWVLVDRLSIERRSCISASWIPSRSVIAKSGEVVFEQAGGEGKTPAFQREVCVQDMRASSSAIPSRACSASTIPSGACPRCQGFGNTIDYDLDLVIPDTSLSLEDGAVDPWTKPQHQWAWKHFKAEHKGKVRFNVPFCDLTRRNAP